MHVKVPALWLSSSLAFCLAVGTFSNAADGGQQASGTPTQISAEDFDWREVVPYLDAAAKLPEEEGITEMLENVGVLRTYFANEAHAECKGTCEATNNRSSLDGEVSKRIAEIVQEEMFHRNKNAVVDYKLTRQPFPFSEIAAVKSEKKRDAYLMLALSDRSYTAAQVQNKYGTPYDTNIFQWYSIFKYQVKTADYTSNAVFEIDPVDGAVIKVAISLKPNKNH